MALAKLYFMDSDNESVGGFFRVLFFEIKIQMNTI